MTTHWLNQRAGGASKRVGESCEETGDVADNVSGFIPELATKPVTFSNYQALLDA